MVWLREPCRPVRMAKAKTTKGRPETPEPTIESVFSPATADAIDVHQEALQLWYDGERVVMATQLQDPSFDARPTRAWAAHASGTFERVPLDASSLGQPTYASHQSFVPRGTSALLYTGSRRFPQQHFELALDTLAITKSPARYPQISDFTPTVMTPHPDGSLWVGGYRTQDSAFGRVYFSTDQGESWTQVPRELPGTVEALSPLGSGVVALAYRSVIAVGRAGFRELAKLKDVVQFAHVDERGVFAFGPTYTAWVAPEAKPKYGSLLTKEDGPTGGCVRLAACGGLFAMARRGPGAGLFLSADALTWARVDGWTGPEPVALVPSATGILAVTREAAVFRVGPRLEGASPPAAPAFFEAAIGGEASPSAIERAFTPGRGRAVLVVGAATAVHTSEPLEALLAQVDPKHVVPAFDPRVMDDLPTENNLVLGVVVGETDGSAEEPQWTAASLRAAMKDAQGAKIHAALSAAAKKQKLELGAVGLWLVATAQTSTARLLVGERAEGGEDAFFGTEGATQRRRPRGIRGAAVALASSADAPSVQVPAESLPTEGTLFLQYQYD